MISLAPRRARPLRALPSPERATPCGLFVLGVAVSLAACAREQVVATLPADPCPMGQCASDAGPGADASADGGADAGAGFCDGRGPVVLTSDSGDPTCGSTIAERTFRFAVCACTDLVLGHHLDTDAFDSARGAYSPGGVGGSVGVNGGLNVTAPMSIGGSVWVGGASGVTASASADVVVGADLVVRGPFASGAGLDVRRDAKIGAALSARSLHVGGTLTLPEGAGLDVSGTSSISSLVRAPVDVRTPCACDEGALLDVAAIVARHVDDHDGAAIGLARDALANVTAATTLELPCGRYYLDRIGAHAPLVLRITGRTALFVAGDVALDDALTVELGAAGELDLFVAGNLVSAGTIMLGSFRTPARARLYVGGAGTIQLSGGGVFAGNLYAPRAELVASAPIELFGSLFVRRLAASAPLAVHYDTAVLRAGEDCPAPPIGACTDACECPNVACARGQCGPCERTSDCCAPLFCVAGRCEASPF
ncbi:hypothetical protein L6R52_25970 [Myxococcota bacterium]|nr:hypothetical protein [Myxococcota bacterium]